MGRDIGAQARVVRFSFLPRAGIAAADRLIERVRRLGQFTIGILDAVERVAQVGNLLLGFGFLPIIVDAVESFLGLCGLFLSGKELFKLLLDEGVNSLQHLRLATHS